MSCSKPRLTLSPPSNLVGASGLLVDRISSNIYSEESYDAQVPTSDTVPLHVPWSQLTPVGRNSRTSTKEEDNDHCVPNVYKRTSKSSRPKSRGGDKNNFGATPLMVAAWHGNAEHILKIMESDNVYLDAADTVGRTALMMAAEQGQKEAVKLLLDTGADVLRVDEFGEAALSIAARKGHAGVAWLLVEGGAEVDVADHFGQTPLMKASQIGHTDIVRLLLERNADFTAVDVNMETALIKAVKRGHPDVVQLLQDFGAMCGVRDKTPRSSTPTTPVFGEQRLRGSSSASDISWLQSLPDKDALALAGMPSEGDESFTSILSNEYRSRSCDQIVPEAVTPINRRRLRHMSSGSSQTSLAAEDTNGSKRSRKIAYWLTKSAAPYAPPSPPSSSTHRMANGIGAGHAQDTLWTGEAQPMSGRRRSSCNKCNYTWEMVNIIGQMSHELDETRSHLTASQQEVAALQQALSAQAQHAPAARPVPPEATQINQLLDAIKSQQAQNEHGQGLGQLEQLVGLVTQGWQSLASEREAFNREKEAWQRQQEAQQQQMLSQVYQPRLPSCLSRNRTSPPFLSDTPQHLGYNRPVYSMTL